MAEEYGSLEVWEVAEKRIPDLVWEANTGGGCTMTGLYLDHYHVVYSDVLAPTVGIYAAFEEGVEYDNPWMETVWWNEPPTLDLVVDLLAQYAAVATAAEEQYAALSDDARALHEYLVGIEVDGPICFLVLMLNDPEQPLGDDPQRVAAALDELIDGEFLADEGVMDPLGGSYLLTLKGGNATVITGADPRFRHEGAVS